MAVVDEPLTLIGSGSYFWNFDNSESLLRSYETIFETTMKALMRKRLIKIDNFS